MSSSARVLRLLAALAAGIGGIATAPGWGTPLTGSGTYLPMPSATGPAAPGIAPSLNTTLSTGTWGFGLNPWDGPFNWTGPYPSSGNTGTTTFEFSGLTFGYLPSGSYFRLGDVDQGSAEQIILTAWELTMSGPTLVTTPWLEQPSFVSGANPAEFVQTNLPGWSFAGGVYTFTGNAASVNPTLTVSLLSNTNIYRLQVQKPDGSNGFGLAAPTPEPGTLGLGVGGALMCALAVRRRRRAG